MTTTDNRHVVTIARMLHAGASIRQIMDDTGLSQEQIRAVARDIPGLKEPAAGVTPSPVAAAGQVITSLPTRVLTKHPGNIRTSLGDITELALTITEHGILQPLLVTRDTTTRTYVVLDGHRRLAAALKAQLTHVPVTVRGTTSAEQAVAIMLVTGLQKAPLDPIDEAEAYRTLEKAGYSQGDIAAMVKKNQGHISQRLALLNLTPDEQAALRQGGITLGDAYRTGRDRSDRRMTGRQNRPKPKRVLHFNASHPLAPTASDLCRKAGHEVLLKLGPACGRCWEDTIRADALRNVQEAS